MTDQTSSNPKSWEMTTLADVADVNNLTIDRNYAFDEIEYIDVASVEERNLTETQKLKLKNAPSRAKRIVSDSSILISTVRPNLKHYCFVKIAKPNLVASTGFAVVNAKKGKSDPYFLYNLLTTKEYTDYLIKIADSQTSTYPAFNPSIIQNSKFVLPSFPEQRAIAGVLSSLDDKIELLREQNKTLEAITQAIFKEWFVAFNFPGATGKMIDSELGEIPEGWRVFYLNEIAETINGYSYKGNELQENGEEALVTLKSFDRAGGFQIRGFKPFSGNPKKNQQVVIGDLIVAHTDLTQDAEVLGNPAFIFDDGGFKKMYITMDLVKIIPKNKDISLGFFYYLMITTKFKKHCVGYSNGTTVLHLSKRAIPEYKLALPNDLYKVKEFSKIAQSTTQKIINNFSQIQTLSKMRDTVLPKLMKGEVRVSSF